MYASQLPTLSPTKLIQVRMQIAAACLQHSPTMWTMRPCIRGHTRHHKQPQLRTLARVATLVSRAQRTNKGEVLHLRLEVSLASLT